MHATVSAPQSVGPVLSAGFTPALLLSMAQEAERRYLELLSQHPPGTFHEGRNEQRRLMEQALACAAWMERKGLDRLPYVGPFGTVPFTRGMRVRVPKGALVYGFRSDEQRAGQPAKMTHVVTAFSVDPGYVWHDGPNGADAVHQPKVHWAGAGGYWRWAYAADLEIAAPAN
ncbi:hypothetical protein [Methylibium petroleiphilum]|uniref:Uncharacterized protein n=1 Tax=Methylibium petroleiphilum (strain ATCC BAA-1232 / LMG 22953 / PM1) TaxID=420662 RepID=A2SMY1_METPP|nr:hypothetical protein [Methylibium petroleiphilum]ABM96920.1 hypothetical protein Mpe_B0142 [Methylibium petroleiphilum PM1]